MKFDVLTKVCSLVFAFLIGGNTSVCIADNTCHCQDPPGGFVQCEDGQIPFCRVREGKVYAVCKSPPADAKKNATAFNVWYASEILETKLRPADLEKKEIQQRLEVRLPDYHTQMAKFRDFDKEKTKQPLKDKTDT